MGVMTTSEPSPVVSPFAPEILGVAQQWRMNAVVTGQDAFKPFLGIGRLPTIYGDCNPRWMADTQNRVVVVKTQPRDNDLPDQLSREAIVARLAAAVGLPVPPVVIWQQHYDVRTTYSAVSYRAFPNASDLSRVDLPIAKNILMRDENFPFAHVFNTWVMRKDCRPHNHVCDTPATTLPQPPVAYIDWSRSLHYSGKIGKDEAPLFRGGEVETGSILRHELPEDRFHVARMRAQLREGQDIYQRIQQVPDNIIAEAVDAVPAPMLTSQSPLSLKDTLRYRRDNIRMLTFRGAGLV